MCPRLIQSGVGLSSKMGPWALSLAQQDRPGRGSSEVGARGARVRRADPTLAHVRGWPVCTLGVTMEGTICWCLCAGLT